VASGLGRLADGTAAAGGAPTGNDPASGHTHQSAAASQGGAPEGSATPTAAPEPPGKGTVDVLHVERAEDPSGSHDVWVYRPAGVPDSADLPVAYFLHGGPGSGKDVFDAGVATLLDDFVAKGGAPFVLASPDGSGVDHPDPDWADDRTGGDRIETWVTNDVIAAVEGERPRDRDHRAIAGFSMGGYGAMNLALRHPDLYGQVASVSGFFHTEDQEGVFGGDPTLEAANSPDQNLGVTPVPRILLADGAQDDEWEVKGETQRFAALLGDRGVDVQLIIAPGHHDWDYMASQLPAVIDFLATGFPQPGPARDAAPS
jgi:S-formylglutathione hydrolase FrmB